MDRKSMYIGKYISIIYRTSQVNINEKMKKINVTSSEYPFILNIPDDKTVNLTYLSNSLYVDPALTTKVITSLVKKGIVEKKRSESDKRSFEVSLTEKGLEIKPIVTSILHDWVEVMTKGMSLETQEGVSDELKCMVKNLASTK